MEWQHEDAQAGDAAAAQSIPADAALEAIAQTHDLVQPQLQPQVNHHHLYQQEQSQEQRLAHKPIIAVHDSQADTAHLSQNNAHQEQAQETFLHPSFVLEQHHDHQQQQQGTTLRNQCDNDAAQLNDGGLPTPAVEAVTVTNNVEVQEEVVMPMKSNGDQGILGNRMSQDDSHANQVTQAVVAAAPMYNNSINAQFNSETPGEDLHGQSAYSSHAQQPVLNTDHDTAANEHSAYSDKQQQSGTQQLSDDPRNATNANNAHSIADYLVGGHPPNATQFGSLNNDAATMTPAIAPIVPVAAYFQGSHIGQQQNQSPLKEVVQEQLHQQHKQQQRQVNQPAPSTNPTVTATSQWQLQQYQQCQY